jgi:glyoxylate/hydroxypyruvate reductase A
MRILLYRGDGKIAPWARDFAQALPHAETVGWQEGELLPPCDYAVLWAPTLPCSTSWRASRRSS